MVRLHRIFLTLVTPPSCSAAFPHKHGEAHFLRVNSLLCFPKGCPPTFFASQIQSRRGCPCSHAHLDRQTEKHTMEKWPFRGHRAGKWQSSDSKRGILIPPSYPFTTACLSAQSGNGVTMKNPHGF